MPDTISRIKLEAQGADQAAREIRKLQDAYDEVAKSAKGIGFSGGSGDPFDRATGGGIPTNAPASLPQRHEEDDRWRRGVAQRQNGNMAMGGGGITSGFQTGVTSMEAVGAGQYGSAAGGAMRGLGAILGGPAAIPLAVAAAAAFGTQKLANNEFDRLGRLWGGGQAQRLGISYEGLRDWEIGMGMEGIPLEQVQQFISAGSQAGINTKTHGISRAASLAMEAVTSMGLDPTTSASLLGALTRSGTGVGTADYDMYATGIGAFGAANVGRYMQELTRSIETLSKQGIEISPSGFSDRQGFIAGLGVFGGMNIDQAVAVNQMIETKGVGAARLGSPEDLLVLQELRAGGMSITQAQIAMEEDPAMVMRSKYERLRRRFGVGSDQLGISMMNETDMSASSTQDLIAFYEKTRGMTPEEIEKETAKMGAGWMGQTYNEGTGEYEQNSKQRDIYRGKQLQLLQGLEKSALALTTEIAGLGQIFTGRIRLNALDVTFGGGLPGEFLTDEEDISAMAEGSRNLNVRALSGYQRMSGMARWDLSNQDPATIDWDDVYERTAAGFAMRANEQIPKTASPERQFEYRQDIYNIMDRFMDTVDVTSSEQAVDILEKMLWALKDVGIVLTDGNEG